MTGNTGLGAQVSRIHDRWWRPLGFWLRVRISQGLRLPPRSPSESSQTACNYQAERAQGCQGSPAPRWRSWLCCRAGSIQWPEFRTHKNLPRRGLTEPKSLALLSSPGLDSPYHSACWPAMNPDPPAGPRPATHPNRCVFALQMAVATSIMGACHEVARRSADACSRTHTAATASCLSTLETFPWHASRCSYCLC